MERVLIVDDALDLGRLWQAALSKALPSLNIMVVPSAEEALLEANYHRIDLLLTDIRLPGMDGLELVERMRRLHADVRVILVTGMKDMDYEDAVKALHVDAFYEKPFELETLLEKVSGLLGLKTPSREPSCVPVEPIEELPAASRRLSDVLVSLRQEVGALAVVLLDQHGKVVELSGEIPVEDFEGIWVPPMLDVLRASCSVSSLLGRSMAENIFAFRGTTFDLMVMAPVGSFSLVSLLKSGRTAIRPAVAFEATSVVQPELIKILEAMGFDLQEEAESQIAVPDTEEVEIEPEEKLEALLSQSTDNLKIKDADAFWEAAPDVSVKTDAETLTYEEAKKRGFAPNQDQG